MSRRTSCLALLAIGCLAVWSQAQAAVAAADANGTWKWSFTTQDGREFELSLELKAEGEKLTGALSLPNGNSIEIKDGAFKSDEVTFQTVFERGGRTFTSKYRGKVEGDTINGKILRKRDGETIERDWQATREKK